MRGIAIVGLNGNGKSTLAHRLCKATGFFCMDVEDYYFPRQRAARLAALEGEPIPPMLCRPFDSPETKQAVEAAMLRDMQAHEHFVLACVHLNWCDELLAHLDVVFDLRVPAEERLKRIAQREAQRFGDRVLPGGDLYQRQQAFHRMAADRTESYVEHSFSALHGPVIVLDGTLPVEENMKAVLETMGI